MGKRLILLLVFSVALSLLGLSCTAGEPPRPYPANPDIRGIITNIQVDGNGRRGVILVEGQIEEDTQFDKAAITITAETRILDQSAGDARPATFASLRVGQKVEVWFIGPVLESYPVQATALEVLILAP